MHKLPRGESRWVIGRCAGDQEFLVVLIGKGNYGGDIENLGEAVEVEEGPVMGQAIQ